MLLHVLSLGFGYKVVSFYIKAANGALPVQVCLLCVCL